MRRGGAAALRCLRRGCVRRAGDAAAAAAAAGGVDGAEKTRLKELLALASRPNGVEVWEEETREPAAPLPASEALSHTQLKIRLFKRLLATAQDDAETRRLEAKIEELLQRVKQHRSIRIDEKRHEPSEASKAADKAALLVLLRYSLRKTTLTQMTYDWLLQDIIDVYGTDMLDDAALLRLLNRAVMEETDAKEVLFSKLEPPAWVNNVEVDPDPEDDCADIREEFSGRMYAIDDASTFEVDDAIAAVFDPQNPDAAPRFSVHVADVSRYLEYNSEVRNQAQITATTVYFPDSIITMLPRSLIEAATLRAAPGVSHCCSVEFSLSDDGTPTDVRLLVCRTANCVRITYDQVNCALRRLGYPEYAGAREVPMPEWWGDADEKAFRAFHETAQRLRGQRTGRGALMLHRPEWYPKVGQKGWRPDPGEDDGAEVHPARDVGDHSVSVRLRQQEKFTSRHIVEEFMLMAGHSVATVCEAERIPCPFRVTTSVPDDAAGTPSGCLAVPPRERPGGNPPEVASLRATSRLRTMKPAFYSAKGLRHLALQRVYSHFTSPLRRYPDLLLHYHVKDHLRRKALAAKGAVASEAEAEHSELLQRLLPGVCESVSRTSISKNRTMQLVSEAWVLLYLKKQMEEENRDVFPAYVGQTTWIAGCPLHAAQSGGKAYCSAVGLQGYGLSGSVYHDGSLAEGDLVDVRVADVEPFANSFRLSLASTPDGPAPAVAAPVAPAAEAGGKAGKGSREKVEEEKVKEKAAEKKKKKAAEKKEKKKAAEEKAADKKAKAEKKKKEKVTQKKEKGEKPKADLPPKDLPPWFFDDAEVEASWAALQSFEPPTADTLGPLTALRTSFESACLAAFEKRAVEPERLEPGAPLPQSAGVCKRLLAAIHGQTAPTKRLRSVQAQLERQKSVLGKLAALENHGVDMAKGTKSRSVPKAAKAAKSLEQLLEKWKMQRAKVAAVFD